MVYDGKGQAGLKAEAGTTVLSLKNPEYFLLSENSKDTVCGCDQEWFGSCWQRRAGCGPSVATNVVLYLHGAGSIRLEEKVESKTDCIGLMETLWRYVTPSEKGVNTLGRFCGGVKKYAKSRGTSLECRTLDIPMKRMSRPALPSVVDFIEKGLDSDCPVAFLNLSNGKVSNLDSWHWVTIVGLETDKVHDRVSAQILDGGKAFGIDLKLWYETTTLGGGFVFFEKP